MSQFASDETPLLHSNHRPSRPKSFAARMLDGIQGLLYRETDQPSWSASGKFFFGRWSNVFLVFVPLSFLADTLDWDAEYQFGFSFFAILPLAVVRPAFCVHVGPYLTLILFSATRRRHRPAGFASGPHFIESRQYLFRQRRRDHCWHHRTHAGTIPHCANIGTLVTFPWATRRFRLCPQLLGSILSSLLLILGSSFFAGRPSQRSQSCLQSACSQILRVLYRRRPQILGE